MESLTFYQVFDHQETGSLTPEPLTQAASQPGQRPKIASANYPGKLPRQATPANHPGKPPRQATPANHPGKPRGSPHGKPPYPPY